MVTKAQEPFGSVSLVVNYFFGLYLYLLLIRKILFQMAIAKRKCTFTNEMQKNIHVLEAGCLACKLGFYISYNLIMMLLRSQIY